MGYSRDLSTYPLEFAQMYDRAQRESYEIDLGDRGQAMALIHKLHAYRRAVEVAKVPGHTNLRNITLRSQGTKIIFDNNDQTMSAIRAAIGHAEPNEADLEAYMKAAFDGDTDDRESEPGHDVQQSSSREQTTPSQEGKVNPNYLELFEEKTGSSKEEQPATGQGENQRKI